MKIKHNPMTDTEVACVVYTKKDGVPIKYVCTTALNGGVSPVDVFYRETPHPDFGNRYFGIGLGSICNADIVESLSFALVEGDDGCLRYSEERHDCKVFRNGNMIDGGRAYTRFSGVVHEYRVKDGGMRRVES